MNPELSSQALGKAIDQAMLTVFQTQLRLPLVRCKESLWPGFGGKEPCLRAVIQLGKGGANGSIQLQLAKTFAARAAAAIFGSASESHDERALMDITGELCNMIAGRVAAGLPDLGPFLLAPPAVSPGNALELEADSRKIPCRTVWSSKGETLILEVDIRRSKL